MTMKPYDYISETMPDSSGWKERHSDALWSPRQHEQPIANLLRAWCDYAEVHKRAYHSKIGEDGVLGEPWAQIGSNLLRLLNGATGRLDCGTLDSIIRDNLMEQGFNPDNM